MGVLKFAGLVAVLFSVVHTAGADKAYIDALTFGADAAVNVLVCDEAGHPIEGANVNYAYWFRDLKHSLSVTGITDRTGHYLATGKCTADVHITVSCEGYYSTRIERYMTSFGAKPYVIDGRWQPYGAECPIMVRKIVNPIPLEYHHCCNLKMPVFNEWIGFDMAEESFLKPYGDGNVADFEVKFNWDGKVRNEYVGAKLQVHFPDDRTGGYWFNKIKTSACQNAMLADTNASYAVDFEFFKRKEFGKWVSQSFPEDKTMVVRTRCKVNDKGEILESWYGQISLLRFAISWKGYATLEIDYLRNPTANDNNLEPDGKKNLWKAQRRMPR